MFHIWILHGIDAVRDIIEGKHQLIVRALFATGTARQDLQRVSSPKR
jgi:hypothetical protein